jgi:hypothetical protein
MSGTDDQPRLQEDGEEMLSRDKPRWEPMERARSLLRKIRMKGTRLVPVHLATGIQMVCPFWPAHYSYVNLIDSSPRLLHQGFELALTSRC